MNKTESSKMYIIKYTVNINNRWYFTVRKTLKKIPRYWKNISYKEIDVKDIDCDIKNEIQ